MKIINSNKKPVLQIILLLIITLNILISAFLCVNIYRDRDKDYETKYTMYIGLNDKDTVRQEIPGDEAKEIIGNICAKYVEGFTMCDADGMWIDENQKNICENSIVCIFYDADEEAIHKAADDILIELNQSSILIEKDEVKKEYYTG